MGRGRIMDSPAGGRNARHPAPRDKTSGLWHHARMLPIKGVYEIAIPVADLARAEGFYREVLGLEVGLRDETRQWLFLRAGGAAGMVVLQETPAGFPALHFAFTVDPGDVARAAALLEERGVAVDGPHVHAWMPATSVYFFDPDGHQLELCAPGYAP
jgi:lactoylglutathione lyase